MKHLMWTVCTVAAITALAMGGAPQVDLSNSQWDLDAKLTATAQTLGKVKADDQATLTFEDQDFTLTGPDGDEITGTFAPDNKAGVTLTPDNDSLVAYVTAKVEDAMADKGITGTVKDVTITGPNKAMVKPTVNNKGTKVTLTVKIKAEVTVTVDDGGAQEDVTAKVNITLTGNAFQEAPDVGDDDNVAGTDWSFTSKVKVTLQGIGGAKDTGDFDLILGPALDVLDGQYCVDTEDGYVFTGTYELGKNGKIALTQNQQQFEAMLEDFAREKMSEDGNSVTNVSVQITDLDITGKVTPGKSFKMTIKAKLLLSADVNGTHIANRKATYTQTCKGVPQ